MKRYLAIGLLTLFPATAYAEEAPLPPPNRVAIGVNVLQPAFYALASSMFGNSMYLPIPIDADVAITDRWGLAGTFQILHHNDGALSMNGLSLMVGPRVQITGRGVTGLYASVKLGMGFDTGHDYNAANYNRVNVIVQPEIGYSLAYKAFFLAFGVGAQVKAQIVEDKSSGWAWNGLGSLLSTCVPVLNITPGVTF